jgi:hypothetical protein
MKKHIINNETFIPVVCELANLVTEERYGDDTWTSDGWDSENEDHCGSRYTEKAQEFFNKTYDEVEKILIQDLNLKINYNLTTTK